MRSELPQIIPAPLYCCLVARVQCFLILKAFRMHLDERLTFNQHSSLGHDKRAESLIYRRYSLLAYPPSRCQGISRAFSRKPNNLPLSLPPWFHNVVAGGTRASLMPLQAARCSMVAG